jgi:NADH-quinone oxidoreductase subunit D
MPAFNSDAIITREERINPTFFPKHQRAVYNRLETKHSSVEIDESDPLGTEMILNIGPQHPATHGVLRVVAKLDGERIEKCVIDIGYLHRGIEKIAEWKTFQEFMPYTDRMDYMSPYSNNVALCVAVEKIAGIEVPERAQYIRTIACELARISSHLLWLGCYLMDIGATTMFMYTFRERETIYSIFDKLAGVRFTVSHCRIGGIQFDMNTETEGMIRDFVANYKKVHRGFEGFMNGNPIIRKRIEGVAYMSREHAIAYGATGPNLRASGVPHDLRIAEPYLIYDQLDFKIPTRTEGDGLARYFVRMEELFESCLIIEQCLAKMPKKGDIRADNAKQTYPSKDEVYSSMEGLIHDFMMTDVGVCPPAGVEVYSGIEAPKGELGFYIRSDGTGAPWRLKIKSPSFANIQLMEKLMEGVLIADMVVVIGSMDPVLGESDK